MEQKELLETRFKEHYPDKRLLAVHLNGFSHNLIFDGGSKDTPVEQEEFSTQAPELFDQSGPASKVFAGIPHYIYQNNAKEVLYLMPEER